MKRHIPNALTLLNLLSGTIALYLVLSDKMQLALLFFFASIVFDFSDGLFARLLNATSEIGKQLDSLADLVSFGLVPASMIYMVIHSQLSGGAADSQIQSDLLQILLPGSVAVVPLFSALRLARFNLQKASDEFSGLPTPGFALFWCGIYYEMTMGSTLFGQSVNVWFIWGLMLISALFMVAPVPMLSLKLKNLKFLPNFSKYLLLFISVIILIFTGISGLPLVILVYILLSLVRIVLT